MDSHIHLSDLVYQNLGDVVFQLIKNSNIVCFCMSENLESSIRTLSLKDKSLDSSDLIHPFVGIHPQYAQKKSDFDFFEEFFELNVNEISGLGEIGLDPTYVHSDGSSFFENQKWIFEKMLSIAEKYNKPVSIHSRRSVDEILQVLSSFRLNHVVFHWYDGSKKNLGKINDLGYFTSFGPYLLYNRDKQNLFKASDPALVLLETDGPVGYKNCFENVLTTPSIIITLVYFVSILLKTSFEDARKLVISNVSKFIQI